MKHEITDYGGLYPHKNKITRKLSDMKDYFSDKNALEKMLKKDPIIYEVFENFNENDISYATTIIYHGKVGDEFFMTKGHYHEKEKGEVYVGISGKGMILLQKDKEIKKFQIENNKLVYVPPGWAHRSINVGKENLIFLAIYPSDVGHVYKESIFSYKVLERNGKVVFEK